MFEISAIPFDGGYEVTVASGEFKGCIRVGCKTEEEAIIYANEVFIPDLQFNFPELPREEEQIPDLQFNFPELPREEEQHAD